MICKIQNMEYKDRSEIETEKTIIWIANVDSVSDGEHRDASEATKQT